MLRIERSPILCFEWVTPISISGCVAIRNGRGRVAPPRELPQRAGEPSAFGWQGCLWQPGLAEPSFICCRLQTRAGETTSSTLAGFFAGSKLRCLWTFAERFFWSSPAEGMACLPKAWPDRPACRQAGAGGLDAALLLPLLFWSLPAVGRCGGIPPLCFCRCFFGARLPKAWLACRRHGLPAVGRCGVLAPLCFAFCGVRRPDRPACRQAGAGGLDAALLYPDRRGRAHATTGSASWERTVRSSFDVGRIYFELVPNFYTLALHPYDRLTEGPPGAAFEPAGRAQAPCDRRLPRLTLFPT